MPRSARLFALAFVLMGQGASAQTDKYHITAEEQAACRSDAERFCLAIYPDEDKMFACMKANRRLLSATCAPIFEAGLRRRGLH